MRGSDAFNRGQRYACAATLALCVALRLGGRSRRSSERFSSLCRCAPIYIRCQRTVAERRDSGKTQVLVVNSLMVPLRSTAPCTPAAASSPAALAGPHVRSRPLLLCAACSDIRSSFTAKGASRVATENHVPTVKALSLGPARPAKRKAANGLLNLISPRSPRPARRPRPPRMARPRHPPSRSSRA